MIDYFLENYSGDILFKKLTLVSVKLPMIEFAWIFRSR